MRVESLLKISGHFLNTRFNAARIVMRAPVPESPVFPLCLTFFSPHKGAGCQGGNQFVARAEAPRAQFWWREGFERLQLDGRIGTARANMTVPPARGAQFGATP